jgi:EAL domain-containing protein (putative c-di-GMP-specific phosphodiesterase class I)
MPKTEAQTRSELINQHLPSLVGTSKTPRNKRLTTEAQLRRALERHEFRLVYQPKVNIADGRIVGFEALLRWSNSLLGEVSPVEFIPIAEHTGLIIPIGAWAREEACRLVQTVTAQGDEAVKVAVNLSPRQLFQKDLVSMIQRYTEQMIIRLCFLIDSSQSPYLR